MEYSDEQHVHFEEHGYVRLGKVLDDVGLAELQQRIDAIMPRRDSLPGDGVSAPTGRTLTTRRCPQSLPATRALRFSTARSWAWSRTPSISPTCSIRSSARSSRRYIGEDVSIFRAMFMNKPAEKGTILPWHQDVGVGWGVGYNPTTTVWTAIDPAMVANGCMQVVPGSHKHGVITEGHFPSAEQLAEYAPPGAEIDLEAEAGEAILLNNLLLHRSGTNPTGQVAPRF